MPEDDDYCEYCDNYDVACTCYDDLDDVVVYDEEIYDLLPIEEEE